MDFHDEKTLIETLANDVWCRLGSTPSWHSGNAPQSRRELQEYAEAFSRDVYKNKASQAAFSDLQRKVIEAEAKVFTESSRSEQMQKSYQERISRLEAQLRETQQALRQCEEDNTELRRRLPDLELAEKYKKLLKALGANGDKYLDALIKRGVSKLGGDRNIKVER
jgi:chromosome segregation ATPase